MAEKLKMKGCIERRKFDSLNSFIEYCDSVTKSNFKNGKQSSITASPDFTGSDSYAHASMLVREGWQDGAEKLTESLNEGVAIGNNHYSANVQHLDVAGGAPIISEWLGGNPECMINTADPIELPVVTVIVHIGALCNVATKRMINRGVGLLLACHHIEMSGATVQIFAYSNQVSQYKRAKHWADCMVQIKAPSDPFDVHVMAYALAHPSMFRRHGFRIIEGLPKPYAEQFCSGYGIQGELTDVEQDDTSIKADWYIPGISQDRGCNYDDLSQSIQHMRSKAMQAGVLKGE